MLKEGEFAPKDIQVRDIKGKLITLSELDLKDNKYIILYFYPKDGTPGCTLEARNLQRIIPDLNEMGVLLVGVSRDSYESHEKFAANNNLDFQLLSDVDGGFSDAFGVIVEKNMFGKKFMGIQRSTFLMDCDFKVLKVWPKVSPKDHHKEVLDYTKQKLG